MNTQQIIQKMTNSGIEKNEAKKELSMLLEHFFHYTELDKIKGIVLDDKQLNFINSKIEERIQNRTPIQYLIGESYFMGEYFKVTPSVLIPRDETELLVKKAIQIINTNNFKNILDIGTGSGCIACIIAKNTSAQVLGTDISSDALRIALDNVTKLGINNKAIFRKSNLFEKIRNEEKFDMIISNPPYIPYGTELSPEVLKEPKEALFAENNGMYFYEKIIKDTPKYLNPNGFLMFEVGINEAELVRKLMQENFADIQTEKDLSGIERIVYGKLR